MTKEEAGQRILEGNPWLWCQTCNGKGKAWTSLDPKSSVRLQMANCPICGGGGLVLETAYAAACLVLDLPFPVRPKDLQETLELFVDKVHSWIAAR